MGRCVQFQEGFQAHTLCSPAGAPGEGREQDWGEGWTVSPGRGPSPSHHVPAVWLRPGAAALCSSSVGASNAPDTNQAKAAGEDRVAAARRDPRRGTPGSGGPETAAAPPRPAPRESRDSAHQAAPQQPRGATEDTGLLLAPLPEPGLALRSSPLPQPNGCLLPVRRSPPGPPPLPPPPPPQLPPDLARLRSAPRLHPSPVRTRRAPTPAWKLQEAPCRPQGFTTRFSSPTRHPPTHVTRKG
ncbi:hypothetical protein NN561_018381 [Cricetulus griseus]